jgi:elongation factor Ts
MLKFIGYSVKYNYDMEISIDLVKQLRDETSVSIAKCKEALEQSGGDMDKAREILREFSAGQMAKKADRELGAGVVVSYIHNTKTIGTLLELLCETDFVAKNEDFIQLAQHIAMHVTAMGSTSETIMEEQFILNPDLTIHQAIEGGIQKLGERIEIGRMHRIQVMG